MKQTKGLKRSFCQMFSDSSDDAESDHEPPVVPAPVDGTREFEEAMLGKSESAHLRALKAMPMEPSTMRTPDCAQPGFYGFPIVPTPERNDKKAPKFQ